MSDDAIEFANAGHVFAGGAKTKVLMPRYDLIPKSAHDALANRFALGAEHYGADNYQKSLLDDAFRRERANHMMAHVIAYLRRDFSEDGAVECLGAIMCNAAMLLESERATQEAAAR